MALARAWACFGNGALRIVIISWSLLRPDAMLWVGGHCRAQRPGPSPSSLPLRVASCDLLGVHLVLLSVEDSVRLGCGRADWGRACCCLCWGARAALPGLSPIKA